MKITIHPAMLWMVLACMLFTSAAKAQWEQVGRAALGRQYHNTITLDTKGVPYTATLFDSASRTEILVRKYNGTSWELMGHTGLFNANKYSLAVDAAGTPYIVADTYSTQGHRLVAKKYNGTNWTPVGNSEVYSGQFSVGGDDIWLAIDAGGTPYIAFVEIPFNIRVLKYDGVSWITVYAVAASSGNIGGFIFDSTGQLFLTYNDGKAVVMKYDGATWATADTTGLNSVSYESIWFFIAPNGIHYAIRQNSYRGSPGVVMKYNGTSWVPLLNSTFSTRPSIYGLVFDAAGTPYIFLNDALLKHNGTEWVSTDTTGHPVGNNYSVIVGDSIGHFYISPLSYGQGDSIRVMKYTTHPESTSVINLPQPGTITMSPVPASHTVTIRNSAATLNGSTAVITDIQGREVYRFAIAVTHTVDVNEWPVGIYCLHLADGQVIKLAKE